MSHLKIRITKEGLVVIDFIDGKGRTIQIEADDECANAYHIGRHIGEVLTTGWRCEDERLPPYVPKVSFLNVENEYQRAGIATEMVRQIYEMVGEPLEPADPELGVGDKNALTIEGMALTRCCQAHGYIKRFSEDRG
jgi:GNAT superfamily N-acetyltransferase